MHNNRLDAEGERFFTTGRVDALSNEKRSVLSVVQHCVRILTTHYSCVPIQSGPKKPRTPSVLLIILSHTNAEQRSRNCH